MQNQPDKVIQVHTTSQVIYGLLHPSNNCKPAYHALRISQLSNQ